jgi:hypothetical protein
VSGRNILRKHGSFDHLMRSSYKTGKPLPKKKSAVFHSSVVWHSACILASIPMIRGNKYRFRCSKHDISHNIKIQLPCAGILVDPNSISNLGTVTGSNQPLFSQIGKFQGVWRTISKMFFSQFLHKCLHYPKSISLRLDFASFPSYFQF